MVVLTAAFVQSFSMVILRLLKDLVTNDTALQYFYMGQLFTNGLLLVGEGGIGTPSEPVSWSFIGIMVLFGLSAYIAQITISRAVFLVPASNVMPFNYVLVVMSFLVDVLVFHQRFNMMAISGIIVVCLSLLFIIKSSNSPKKKIEPPSEDTA